MSAAMSAGAATVTGGVAKASTALFSSLASLKLQAERVGNSISIRRVEAEENQGAHPILGSALCKRASIQVWGMSSARSSQPQSWQAYLSSQKRFQAAVPSSVTFTINLNSDAHARILQA